MANDCVNPNIDSGSIGNADVTEIEWREAITNAASFMIAKYISRSGRRWMSSVYGSFMQSNASDRTRYSLWLIEPNIA